MKTLKEYLELDGGLIFKMAIYNRFSSIGDMCYSDICGGYVTGVYQWADHNLYNVEECFNDKYTGWVLALGWDIPTERKIFIENWVLNIVPKDFKHAKNLFNKYLKALPSNN